MISAIVTAIEQIASLFSRFDLSASLTKLGVFVIDMGQLSSIQCSLLSLLYRFNASETLLGARL